MMVVAWSVLNFSICQCVLISEAANGACGRECYKISEY